jgi:GntR family transcriptional regulator, L-lactate dehydrogenase operon regulator
MEELQFAARHLVPRPVRHGNAFEETIERLLTSIKLGIFAVGHKLPPERELAEMLGVSRATLREALAELQKANYIEVKRGRYGGTVVAGNAPANSSRKAKPDPAELEDVLVFRQVVEPAAAALAAEASLSPSARNHLLTALADASTAPAELFRPKDARFHIAIAELAGSPSLIAAVADVRARVSDLLDLIPLLPPNLEHSNEQHQEIVDAILRGDSDAARKAASHHIEGTANLLRGFLT